VNELPPPDRPIPNRHPRSLPRGSHPSDDRWLTDFLRREGRVLGRGLSSASGPAYDRAKNARTIPVRFVIGMLLTAASIVVVTYYNIILGSPIDSAKVVAVTAPSSGHQVAPLAAGASAAQSDHHAGAPLAVAITRAEPDHYAAPPLRVALTTPEPDRQAAPPLTVVLTTPEPDRQTAQPLTVALAAPEPDRQAAPPLTVVLTTPEPDRQATPPLTVALAAPEPDRQGAPPLTVVRNTPESDRHALPSAVANSTPEPDRHAAPLVAVALTTPETDHRAGAPLTVAVTEPEPDHGAPPLAPVVGTPTLDARPTGAALHLLIVYRGSARASKSRIEALTERLHSQNTDIASATVSSGPAAVEGVSYFFTVDRAGASRIAASLARMTRREEPVMLEHSAPLPRPGTIVIWITLNDQKEFIDENF
jgi:hypothetical protein